MLAAQSSADTEKGEVTLQEKVFGNELLLRKILTFAIYNEESLSPEMVTCCRLVLREWLKMVNDTLGKDADYLVSLSTRDASSHKRLKEFRNTFGDLPGNRILPFLFTHRSHFDHQFSREDMASCVECLTKCGAGLRQIHVLCYHGIPDSARETASLPTDLKAVTFPNLRKFDITETCNPNGSCSTDRGIVGRTMPLVQWILSGTERLQELNVRQMCVEPPCEAYLEIDVGKLTLPATITEACIASPFGPNYFASLFMENFSNITRLTLRMEHRECKQLVENAINCFHNQLHEFDVRCCDCGSSMWTVALDKRNTFNKCHPLQPNLNKGLGKIFPVLKKIDFESVKYEISVKILEISRFQCVETAGIGLTHLELKDRNQEQESVLHMIRVKNAFPNVTLLDVTIPYSEKLPALKYIFEELTQLRKLAINTIYTQTPTSMKGEVDILTACFLGIKPEEVSTFKDTRDNWECLTLSSGEIPTVMHMQEIRELYLNCEKPDDDIVEEEDTNIDVLVYFGLITMKPLRKLFLDGYTVSPGIIQSWKDMGNVLFQ